MKKARKKPAEPASWRVYMLRGRAAYLGTVEAQDREAAIKKAIRAFDVPMKDRFRISVQRQSSGPS